MYFFIEFEPLCQNFGSLYNAYSPSLQVNYFSTHFDLKIKLFKVALNRDALISP